MFGSDLVVGRQAQLVSADEALPVTRPKLLSESYEILLSGTCLFGTTWAKCPLSTAMNLVSTAQCDHA